MRKMGGIDMEWKKARAILMKLKISELYDEPWLLHHAGCTLNDLNELVEKGWLGKREKDPNNYMSNNRYYLTREGKEFAEN